jgi:hypothetical protein
MHPLGIVVEGWLGDLGAWWRRERSTVLLLPRRSRSSSCHAAFAWSR